MILDHDGDFIGEADKRFLNWAVAGGTCVCLGEIFVQLALNF
jgi:hypothetical protein